jgi:hypothetical protein
MALPQTISRPRPQENPGHGRMTTNGHMSPAEIIERVLIHGDLAQLTTEQRTEYYKRVCESIGVNPLTKPFAYIKLNGKLVLYALRDCTDQLRKVHHVSVVETAEAELNGVYIVTTKVAMPDGRTDMARGAVNIAGLKGENLANALMKTETKAKRRATLSICGLGLLDETEIEDITPDRKSSAKAKKDGTTEIFNEIIAHIRNAANVETLETIRDAYAQELADLPHRWALLASQEFEDRWSDLGGEPSECPIQAQDD